MPRPESVSHSLTRSREMPARRRPSGLKVSSHTIRGAGTSCRTCAARPPSPAGLSRSTLTTRSWVPAVAAERDADDPARVAHQGDGFLAGGGVPEAHQAGVLLAAGGEPVAPGREGGRNAGAGRLRVDRQGVLGEQDAGRPVPALQL